MFEIKANNANSTFQEIMRQQAIKKLHFGFIICIYCSTKFINTFKNYIIEYTNLVPQCLNISNMLISLVSLSV